MSESEKGAEKVRKRERDCVIKRNCVNQCDQPSLPCRQKAMGRTYHPGQLKSSFKVSE